jgi:bile-acid 7alpha-dehydratase
MSQQEELEAVKRLKYKYIRCLDLKRWDEIAECFTENARAAYSDGKYSFEGRDEILAFFRQSMPRELITSHHVHQPEIEFTSDTTATGVWALQDTVIHTGYDITIRGAAFYHDEYVKVGGEWKIQATGYERLFEEMQPRKDVPGLQLTANYWAEDGD